MIAEKSLLSKYQPFWTPEELANELHVSPNTIRSWFKDESDVLQWGRKDSRPGRQRAYLSMRIPHHVAERVIRRMLRP